LGVGAALVALALVAVVIATSMLTKRIEPFLRDQAVAYLRERFRSEVQLAGLQLKLPKLSPLGLYRTKGFGSIVRVTGTGLMLRWQGDPGRAPLFSTSRFSFEVDLGTLWERKPIVRRVVLENLQIAVPPKQQRPKSASTGSAGGNGPKVTVEDVTIRNAMLHILPKDPSRQPLEFAIADLKLTARPNTTAMHYEAKLTNPKPPGNIDSTGEFGPWNADEPGDSPLHGEYTFSNADLGIFSGIAGILHSTGSFQGTLDELHVKGEAKVPDFRLKMSGNPVPLQTNFEALVDGTNGNTVLQPVKALLGSTRFTTSGAIIKHEGARRRDITLDVRMPNGNMRDLLRLATKGQPFMEGTIRLKTSIAIPPLTGTVKGKLRLNGNFDITSGHFLKTNIQDQIDSLSRRGQGQPKNTEVDEVFSTMRGKFRLENQLLSFSSLTFGVPGADVHLAGSYDLAGDTLDFHGALRLQAKVSQTQTGWKRWALKPVDPFFAKNGAGTFLRIKVEGPSKKPSFGLDRGKSHENDSGRARKASTGSARR
jgi:hypothetical protein